jgi:hypothetical protein
MFISRISDRRSLVYTATRKRPPTFHFSAKQVGSHLLKSFITRAAKSQLYGGMIRDSHRGMIRYRRDQHFVIYLGRSKSTAPRPCRLWLYLQPVGVRLCRVASGFASAEAGATHSSGPVQRRIFRRDAPAKKTGCPACRRGRGTDRPSIMAPPPNRASPYAVEIDNNYQRTRVSNDWEPRAAPP